ncbi:MAG: efflux RND transporter periplasmic adaptor subunit [Phycisphaerales bacterium]|nr:efflux RND transporter periplasmic adaptor subunit [Phycisphaerales bacterium]
MNNTVGKKSSVVVPVVLALMAGAIGGYLIGHFIGGAASPGTGIKLKLHKHPLPVVVPVATAMLRQGVIAQRINAYGVVIAKPSAIRNISVAFESQVSQILVTAGQRVHVHEPLLQLTASPDALLQLQQAQSAASALAKDLQQVQEQYQLRLATQGQLLLAKQQYAQAKLKLSALVSRGIGKVITIKADHNGIVALTPVQVGQIAPPGAPLVEIVSSRDILVRLGVEPEDSIQLHQGEAVQLFQVSRRSSAALNGHIALITQSVDPATRLVNVFVTPASGSDLLLGQYIRGVITLASQRGLLAPRQAVLPQHGQNILYTVKDGVAVRHVVHVGLHNSAEYEVAGVGLAAGDPVVIVGNSELADGMQVSVGANR